MVHAHRESHCCLTFKPLGCLYGTVPGMARFGYARVSTRGQKDDSQTDTLTAAVCSRVISDVERDDGMLQDAARINVQAVLFAGIRVRAAACRRRGP